tara:strand:+ start:769 stop:1701 length:933 start_codon:yes stop_codon:yes gene_type:complete
VIKLKYLLDESRAMTPMKHSEWYPAHTRDALEWTLTHNYVPIYPKTMEQVIGKTRVNSFHVTSPQNIESLQKVIGKKKSISTFTKANKSSPLAKGRGVQTGTGGVIFHVDGILLARQYMDFDTVPDRTGRRWVMGRYVFGDPMIVPSAMKKAKIADHQKWREIEYEAEQKYNIRDYDSYKDYDAAIKKHLAPIVAKHIKKYIDITNKLLKKYKKDVIQNLAQPSKKTSAWWNELIIYDTKVVDVFVLKRVYDDYYFQKDKTYEPEGGRSKESYKKILLKYVPESKITVGSPAQFRKWYNARQGEITLDDQ